jgi:Domain of unknown function (DUF6895)
MATPLDRACGWVDAHLGEFAVDRAAPAVARMPPVKAVAELAHAAEVLERSEQPGAAATGRRWMDHAWRQIDGGEVIRELIAADARFVPAVITFLPFHLSGRTSARLTATLAAQLAVAPLDPLGCTMTVPAAQILGARPPPALVAGARPLSVLASRTAPAVLPQDAVYVLVHECLYETRWGRRAPGWDDATAAYVAAALPALIERFTADLDADLLAELALAVHAVSADRVPDPAWAALAGAQVAGGNVEPARLVTIFPRLPHPVLTRTYHTTLVAIMAWASRPRR